MSIYEESIDRVLSRLGRRLRAARLKANLTQKALAEQTGVSLKTVANAEDGQNISLETLLLMMRGVDRLQDIDGLLVDEGPSPVDVARRQGSVRQRASGRHVAEDKSADGWEW